MVEEETDEIIYFLELLQALNENHKNVIEPFINEGVEILKIIVASINTVRNRISSNQK